MNDNLCSPVYWFQKQDFKQNFIENGEIRKEEKDMKFIPSFSLAYSSKVKQHKEIVQQLSTMV